MSRKFSYLTNLLGKSTSVCRIHTAALSFSADCLETLEEVAIRGRETFEEAGGTDFAYLPCLNDRSVGMEMLEALIRRELQGWA